MFIVKNETTEYLEVNGTMLQPNASMQVNNNIFAITNVRKANRKVCEIISEYGKHTCKCSKSIKCFPKKGEDSTVFTIS